MIMHTGEVSTTFEPATAADRFRRMLDISVFETENRLGLLKNLTKRRTVADR